MDHPLAVKLYIVKTEGISPRGLCSVLLCFLTQLPGGKHQERSITSGCVCVNSDQHPKCCGIVIINCNSYQNCNHYSSEYFHQNVSGLQSGYFDVIKDYIKV